MTYSDKYSPQALERRRAWDRERNQRPARKAMLRAGQRHRRGLFILPEGHPKQCRSPGCPRHIVSNGLCERHYWQMRKGIYTGKPPRGYRQNDPWLIFHDDGIVDEVAIEIAARGTRKVRLTKTERLAAAKLIIERGGGFPELQENLCTNSKGARQLAEALGYRVSRLFRGGTAALVPCQLASVERTG